VDTDSSYAADALAADVPHVSRGTTLLLERLAPWLITAAAGVVRFARLASPHAIIPLDETYYAKDAHSYLMHGVESGFAVHPPVGKWMIAFGEWVFGYNSFGWRFSAAVVGTLSILLVYRIAKLLWGGTFAPVVASILLAVDGLFFVQSRIAMLDIFLAFWIIVGFWLLLEDRVRTAPDHRGLRWWRLASGVAFGLAAASKWSGAFLLPMLVVIAVAWEIGRLRTRPEWQARTLALFTFPPLIVTEVFLVHSIFYRAVVGVGIVLLAAAWLVVELLRVGRDRTEAPADGTGGGPVLRQLIAVGFTFVVIPAGVYLGSYIPWFYSTQRYVPPRCNVTKTVNGRTQDVPMAGMRFWLCYQREIYDYHKNLKAIGPDGKPIHPYLSHAWSWPWIGRPAAHYFAADRRTVVRKGTTSQVTYDAEILGLPNPVVWWPAFIVAIPLLLWWGGGKTLWSEVGALFRRRRAGAEPHQGVPPIDATAVLLVAMFAPLYLPWLITTRPLFMFYMTPAVPFLVLALTHALWRWTRIRSSRVGIVSAYVALAAVSFAYFYPVLAAYPVLDTAWRSRMWFGGNRIPILSGDCLSKAMKIRCWI
jgi:dolichyl-phosphate-mannose--protein O-mannosyl transferase